MFDKLFGWGKKKVEEPAIPFGRYSDNNKTVEKVDFWTQADNLFKQQQYPESVEAFLVTCGMRLNRMWYWSAMAPKAASIYTRGRKLCGENSIMNA
ncbi:hypothetical protein [Paraflavitalea speifideaquila]|uniref:hypothetical protein n=1 Tax=Paraflavitalea speifideaquila TaxID=3076558 RepID=UPI0028E69DA9|nr:hypothetical protein [Paraflavitalea speifideiaquila]